MATMTDDNGVKRARPESVVVRSGQAWGMFYPDNHSPYDQWYWLGADSPQLRSEMDRAGVPVVNA